MHRSEASLQAPISVIGRSGKTGWGVTPLFTGPGRRIRPCQRFSGQGFQKALAAAQDRSTRLFPQQRGAGEGFVTLAEQHVLLRQPRHFAAVPPLAAGGIRKEGS
ncbi:hypothetical protein SAMN00790413_02139 [Deinococcus hopiensis KR-140]|uniref:Uncharacterized protein n=1 Tax=Deinococcus hopiensis KR-140 TaxID=695939 RepID=A0A1W1VLM0_9DEIO|nr:hypothetical protein SAMN00790413_02139 [Deinococcus hopiensis KR-140]